MTQKIRPTMLLVTAPWQNQKSFRLIPIDNDSPFSEGIYDPDSKVLVLMSKIRKETMHMLPKLDENGDAVMTKTKRANGKNHKEQRVTLETFTEYYVTEKQEITDTINMLAINSEEFDFKPMLEVSTIIQPEKPKIQLMT